MNICFVVNKNYIGQLKVAIKSLFETNKENINIYLLENDLTETDQVDLTRYVDSFGSNIVYVKMSDEYFKGLPRMGYDKSYTAYFKIMIPYVLNNLDKVLYLDCDLLVRKNLSDLYSRDTNNFISASLDIKMNKNKKDHIKNICGLDTKYFNSGVILFDFKYSNDIVPQKEMIDYILSNKDVIKYHDQDILNHFYYDSFDEIDECYNSHTIYYSVKELFSNKRLKRAYIVHYANWKPWNSNYIGKAYKMYLKEYNSIKKNENLNYLKRRNIFSMLKLIFKYIF